MNFKEETLLKNLPILPSFHSRNNGHRVIWCMSID